MTLPDERINSIKKTREFLRSLLDPKQTPRVARKIREAAYSCLRHYPADFYIKDIFSEIHKDEEKMVRKVLK